MLERKVHGLTRWHDYTRDDIRKIQQHNLNATVEIQKLQQSASEGHNNHTTQRDDLATLVARLEPRRSESFLLLLPFFFDLSLFLPLALVAPGCSSALSSPASSIAVFASIFCIPTMKSW